MRVCLDSVLEKIPLGFQDDVSSATRSPAVHDDKPVTLAAIAAVHAKLKLEVGRYARVNRRWDELVREYQVLQAVIKKVRRDRPPE